MFTTTCLPICAFVNARETFIHRKMSLPIIQRASLDSVDVMSGTIFNFCCLPQVYNLTTYPHFVGLLETLGIETEPSDMSFALSVDAGAVEWGSRGLNAIFGQRSNLLRPAFWRMLADVIRFGHAAPEVGTCLGPTGTGGIILRL